MHRRMGNFFRRASQFFSAGVALSAIVMGMAEVWVHAAESSATKTDSIDWEKERQFWAFQAPQRHAFPKVADSEWPSQPMDFFILAKLEAAKLAPAEPAPRRALIRRVTLDLTGLPPTPAV